MEYLPMKSTLPLVSLVAGGLGIGAIAATAQTSPNPAPPAASQSQQTEQSSAPFDMLGGRLFERMPRFSPEDRAAFFDARVAAIHAGLRLTPDQEKLWPALESAARDAMRTMTDERQKLRAAGPAANPVERLQRRAELLTLRGQSLKKVADAAQPLYASLTDEQKHRLPMLMHGGHHGWRERVGMWMRHHGWGRGGEGGGPGWRQGRMGPGNGDYDRGGRGWDRY
jgi:hypothetical protein